MEDLRDAQDAIGATQSKSLALAKLRPETLRIISARATVLVRRELGIGFRGKVAGRSQAGTGKSCDGRGISHGGMQHVHAVPMTRSSIAMPLPNSGVPVLGVPNLTMAASMA